MIFRITKSELKETLKVYDNLEINKSIDSAVDRYFNEKKEEDAHNEAILTELGSLRTQNKTAYRLLYGLASRIDREAITDLGDVLREIRKIQDILGSVDEIDFPN